MAATTGLRRGELCGLRHGRDLDEQANVLRVSSSVAALPKTPVQEIPTKNRRTRIVALDEFTASVLAAQVSSLVSRAKLAGVELVDEHYVFSDAIDGSVPWKPDSLSQYFGRVRDRAGVPHISLHGLRKFMETYGQEMGYSMTQVALRAGHNPAWRHATTAARSSRPTASSLAPSPACWRRNESR